MTTSLDAERLYALLPALYRLRDAGQGEPLRALLAAFARELALLEENIAQLYDDQFIETCADWVVPYIGDLIGYRPLHAWQGAETSRTEVANTIAFRRRKGTASMLEQLARDVTGWPARTVEFFEQLATTQYMKHVRLHAPATADLRAARAPLQLGGPFNRLAHSIDVRRPEAGAGRYNIPNVGIFLWRLQPRRLSRVRLTRDPLDQTRRKFRVNPLGADVQLFRWPQPEGDISHLAEPINVPEPLTVRGLARSIRAAQARPEPDAQVVDDYGEQEQSLALFEGGKLVPLSRIVVCDLRDTPAAAGQTVPVWNHEASLSGEAIAVDPERGRILLGPDAVGRRHSVTFHQGGARSIGGGEYTRSPEGSDLRPQLTASGGQSLRPALEQVASGGCLSIQDSTTYAQNIGFDLDAGVVVVVAARDAARPLIACTRNLTTKVRPGSRLILDGLVISGRALQFVSGSIGGEPRELLLRDCTLVPGWKLEPSGNPVSPGAPSLLIEHPQALVTLERCITGPIFAVPEAQVELRDCIVDAGAAENVAFAGSATGGPGATLGIDGSTIIGKLHTRQLRLASNSIFFARRGADPSETWRAPLIAERRQEGCLRFSYVPPGSITPRRHRCVPDGSAPAVEPQFTSLRYGDAAYCQLRSITDRSIRQGADDEGEMGVMHALSQPQREANLRIRLEEYLRFGLRAGVFYAT